MTMTLAADAEHQLAAHCDAALVAYQAKWNARLRRLQRAHPERWRVAGLSDEEVRDALTLRLLEVVRGERALWAEHERPDKDWTLCVVERELSTLRKRFRVEATPMDLRDVPLLEPLPSQEQCLLDAEADEHRARAAASAQAELNRAQRRWYAALKSSAHQGGFFQESEQPNLSAAARVLGKHRSSAVRAYQELRTRFQSELESLG